MTQLRDQLIGIAWTLLGVFLVLISSAVAFVATCVPIGLIGMQGGDANADPTRIAVWVGGLAALVAGGAMTYFLIRRSHARAARNRPEKEQP